MGISTALQDENHKKDTINRVQEWNKIKQKQNK